MRRLALIALLLAAFEPVAALAVTPDEMLKDPALEARARHISEGLRCLVCQNESIDDSQAPLAHDLRVLVRQRLTAGDTDAQVVNYIVARYGEFVLLKPRFEPHTYLLWALPPAALIAGIIGLFLVARRRRSVNTETVALSIEEKRKLSTLVEGGAE
jgi:cytochrome c-type biogenesis protein CcmH